MLVGGLLERKLGGRKAAIVGSVIYTYVLFLTGFSGSGSVRQGDGRANSLVYSRHSRILPSKMAHC